MSRGCCWGVSTGGGVGVQTTAAAVPDLSLHISPPSPPAGGVEVLPEPRLLLGLGLGPGPGLELDDDDAAVATKKVDDDDDAAAAAREHNLHAQRLRLQLHQPSQTAHGFKKSSSGTAAGGGRRSSRAPRMRWTTALHAHFVHAVELLGGHESTLKFRGERLTN
jgi:hypothetical protein